MTLRILLVDDDDVDRESVHRSLAQTQLNAEIFEVVDAASALSVMRAKTFDCVLLDYQLPDQDGIEVLKDLRTVERLRNVPIVILTGEGDERTAVSAIRRGAQDYLSKQKITPELLGRTIKGAVDRARLERERQKVEEELKESEARFRQAFATAPHGMALVAPDGRWLKVNQALCGVFGYTEAELVQSDSQSITHPDDLEADQELARKVVAGETPSYAMEKRYRRKDGEVVWTLFSASLIRDSGGAPRYFVAQILDLTERHRAEQQLRQAQKMEAIGQLTGGIAHDFNNLLTVITGNARLLQRKLGGDPELANQASFILRASGRGAELVRRMLAFGRRQELAPQAVDAHELITDMRDMLQLTLGELIEIRTRCDGKPDPVFVDANELENAILNLAVNARDAMPKGGTLTISIADRTVTHDGAQDADAPPGEYLAISVTDTGVGIPRESIDRIFEPFFTTKEVGKGTGLGLSMAYGFVKQSGGHIEVESEPDKGTTMRILLPKTAHRVARRPDRRPTRQQPHGGDEKILIVEDEAPVRALAVTLLKELGYSVVEAASGSEALTLLTDQPDVDLLFTDVVMPGGLSGPELYQRARRLRPDIKVLYTSGHSRDAMAQSSSAQPMSEFLPKPYDDVALAQKVQAVLNA